MVPGGAGLEASQHPVAARCNPRHGPPASQPGGQGNVRTLLILAGLLAAAPALAQPAANPPANSAAPESRQAVPGGETAIKPGEEAATGLWDRANLFGTLGGLRPALKDRGITFGLTESSEVFGNPTGGVAPRPWSMRG